MFRVIIKRLDLSEKRSFFIAIKNHVQVIFFDKRNYDVISIMTNFGSFLKCGTSAQLNRGFVFYCKISEWHLVGYCFSSWQDLRRI